MSESGGLDARNPARRSSLFDVPEKRLRAVGSSIISFACEPKLEEDLPRAVRRTRYENTYKLEPPVKLSVETFGPVIEEILASNLQGRHYDPIDCSFLAKTLADEIKMKAKELNFKRYKLISLVTIGEKKDQGVKVGSRFLWDADRDNYASGNYESRHLFAVGQLYGVYYE